MKLIKTSKHIKPEAKTSQEGRLGKAINRRTFMRRTGLTLGGGWIGAILTGLIGAVALLFIVGLFKKE